MLDAGTGGWWRALTGVERGRGTWGQAGWGRGVNDCGRGGENRNRNKNKDLTCGMWFVAPGTP